MPVFPRSQIRGFACGGIRMRLKSNCIVHGRRWSQAHPPIGCAGFIQLLFTFDGPRLLAINCAGRSVPARAQHTTKVYKLHLKARGEGSKRERMVGPVRPQFVLFGSSIVEFSFINEGWGAVLADLYARKADIVLRGYSGWNSRRALQILDQVFPKDAVVQPSLVIVYFGGNDAIRPHASGLGPHVPLPEYIENMRKIALHLRSLSEETRIIFLSAPPVNEEQICKTFRINSQQLTRTNELCRIYSEACLELCREMDIKAIDLWNAIQERDDWLTSSFTDGIHFSFEASRIVVKEIIKVISEAKWEPSLHFKSIPLEFGEDSPYDPVSPDGKTTVNVSDKCYHRKKLWELETKLLRV